MIVFHEGLPGSGKSYEACVMHILPALTQGRDVLTNINGIDHKKFSEITGIPLPIVEQKLICISHAECDDEEQRLQLVKDDILAKTKKDSLLVLDEIQDMFPTTRKPLSPDWSKFIASHRHEGLDFVLMGQDRRDVHTMWRRRIQRLIAFNKLSAVGAEKSYRWECFEATRPETFKVVSSGIRAYDSKYFGLYLSHTQGTTNKSVYKDDRANILKNKNLQFGVVIFFVLAYYGITHTISFFNGEGQGTSVATSSKASSSVPAVRTAVTKSSAASKVNHSGVSASAVAVLPPVDVFDQESREGRLRLAAWVQSGDKLFFRVEIIDTYGRLYSVFDQTALVDLGWKVAIHSYGITLQKGNVIHVARMWALDNNFGQVNRRLATSLGE